VLRIRRKTRSEMARAELGESFDHFMRAATHTANGVGARVGPRVDTARAFVAPQTAKLKGAANSGWTSTIATLAPLAAAASDGARQAGLKADKTKAKGMKKVQQASGRKQSSRRWPRALGVVALTAAGAAAFAAMRRRRQQQQWDEYDPSHSLVEPESRLDKAADKLDSAIGTAAQKAEPAADKAGDTMSSSAQPMSDSAKKAAGKAEGKADDTLTDLGSRNSRS
jgi:hypothetical protein